MFAEKSETFEYNNNYHNNNNSNMNRIKRLSSIIVVVVTVFICCWILFSIPRLVKDVCISMIQMDELETAHIRSKLYLFYTYIIISNTCVKNCLREGTFWMCWTRFLWMNRVKNCQQRNKLNVFLWLSTLHYFGFRLRVL